MNIFENYLTKINKVILDNQNLLNLDNIENIKNVNLEVLLQILILIYHQI